MKYSKELKRWFTEDNKYMIKKNYRTDDYEIYYTDGRPFLDEQMHHVGFGFLRRAKAYVENMYK